MAGHAETSEQPKRYDAFVSHTDEAAHWVDQFVSDLEDLGLSISHSRRREPGRSYKEATGNLLENSKYMLLVISPDACCSSRVRDDIDRWNPGPSKPLIAIDLWGCPYPHTAVETPISLISYEAESYWDQIHDLAKKISGRAIPDPSKRKRRKGRAPLGCKVDGALSRGAVQILTFLEMLRSIWERFQEGSAIANMDHRGELAMESLRVAYLHLRNAGGLKSKKKLLALLIDVREDLEAAAGIIDHQRSNSASGEWWKEVYVELEEAINAEEEIARERARQEEEEKQLREDEEKLEQELQEKQREVDALENARAKAIAEQQKDELPPGPHTDTVEEARSPFEAPLRKSESNLKNVLEKLSLMEKSWPSNTLVANTPTWEEVIAAPPKYEVSTFEDVVLCMHPDAESAWQDTVPNARAAGLRCVKIDTPDGAWHRDKKPDAAQWKRIFADVRAKAQEARDMKVKRIHLVAKAPFSMGALLGSLLDPQNHRLIVYQPHNIQGQKEQKAWQPYGPEWASSPGQRAEPFFEEPPGLNVHRPEDDSHIAVVVNISGTGNPEVCRNAARAHARGKSVHLVHLKAKKTGHGSIGVPADADRAANELDQRLQQLAENLPGTTLHLFYYGPLAVLVRGARSLGLRRVPILVYEAMKYDDAWHWVPAIRFPEGHLLIGEPQTGVGGGVAAASVVTGKPTAPAPTAAIGGSGGSTGRAVPLDKFSFPGGLVEAYQRDELAVLVGSGASIAEDVVGNFPRWDQLAERLLEQVEYYHGAGIKEQTDKRRAVLKTGSLEEMLMDLDPIKTALGQHYQTVLTKLFRPTDAMPGDIHRALIELNVRLLLTTNYDALLEAAEGPPARTLFTWREADMALADYQHGRKVLLKIHGTADRRDTVIMTNVEYLSARNEPSYPHIVGHLFQGHTFLLVGYGVNDPLDLDLVFKLNANDFRSAARTHYALLRGQQSVDRVRALKEMNVQVIPYDEHAQLPGILRALRTKK